MKTVACIQYLRAVAAIMVVLHHITIEIGTPFRVGAAGVDLFFVVSGFIMVSITIAKNPTASEFLRNRVERIVPLYWLITLSLLMPDLSIPGDSAQLAATLQQLSTSLFFIPQHNRDGGISPAYIPGWTLNYEMFFYCIVAVSLLLPRRARLAAIVAMICGLCLIGALLQPRAPALHVWTNPVLLEFAAGGILGMLWVRGRIPGPATGVLLLLGGVGAYAGLEAMALHSEAWRVALWGGPAVIIVLGALALEPRREPPLLRPLRLLGDASYSIYLLNLIVITAVAAAMGRDNPAMLLFVAMTATLASALGCYLLFERPATRALRAIGNRTHATQASIP